MINALLVFKDEAVQQKVVNSLQIYYRNQLKIETILSLQEAIEHLEANKTNFDLILFEQKSPSLTMAKILFPLGNGAKYIMCEETRHDVTPISSDYIVEHLPLNAIDVELPKLIKKLEVLGHLLPVTNVQEEYVSVSADVMASYCPLNYNVFIKMGESRFVKLFNKGDQIDRADFDRYQKEKGVKFFYFSKSEYKEVLENSSHKLDAIANTEPLPADIVVKEAIKSHEAVKDIISQLGFTPQAQMIAKSSVAMTMKLLGSKPKLAKILDDLKKKEGDYISSHSIAVGTLACAIAYKMEWHSAATFFKLSLAAFMHDITLSDKLAHINSLEEATKNKYSAEEINKIKLHPVHAADYVRRMNEIPPDVDQVVFQHHERPDGSGFPRSLSGKFISPLSSVFIISHAIVDFMHAREGESIDVFLAENEELYHQGTFRKIWLALKSDSRL